MQDIIKQWPILSLLPMCTTDAGLSIEASFANNYMHYHAQVKQRDLGWAWF